MHFSPWKSAVVLLSVSLVITAEEIPPAEFPAAVLPPTRLDAPIVIGRFVPPEPGPSKEVPAMRVESSVSRQIDGKPLTVLLGEPSALPDIPRPAAAPSPAAEEIAGNEVPAAAQPQEVFLQMGATVYGRRTSVVHWRHSQKPGAGYEAVVGLDFGLFANVGSFHHRGIPHSLLLLCSEEPADHADRPSPVPPGTWRVTRGDAADPAGMAPLTALMDLCAAEKDQLLAAHAARRKHLAEAEAWRKANPPPEPAVHTFWLRPHRGSRYLKAQAEGVAR